MATGSDEAHVGGDKNEETIASEDEALKSGGVQTTRGPPAAEAAPPTQWSREDANGTERNGRRKQGMGASAPREGAAMRPAQTAIETTDAGGGDDWAGTESAGFVCRAL